MLIFHLKGMLWKLNELSLSLQNMDMNIVRTKQIIKAFMYKMVIWKMKVMTHNFCLFPSLDGKEIDCELQIVIVNHFSSLRDKYETRSRDLLQLNIVPPSVNFLHTMTMEHVMDHPECVQIDLCEAIATNI